MAAPFRTVMEENARPAHLSNDDYRAAANFDHYLAGVRDEHRGRIRRTLATSKESDLQINPDHLGMMVVDSRYGVAGAGNHSQDWVFNVFRAAGFVMAAGIPFHNRVFVLANVRKVKVGLEYSPQRNNPNLVALQETRGIGPLRWAPWPKLTDVRGREAVARAVKDSDVPRGLNDADTIVRTLFTKGLLLKDLPLVSVETRATLSIHVADSISDGFVQTRVLC